MNFMAQQGMTNKIREGVEKNLTEKLTLLICVLPTWTFVCVCVNWKKSTLVLLTCEL